MYKQLAVTFSTILLAFFILSVSVLRAASIRYSFYQEANKDNGVIPEIEYQLPYPGRILPDSPLWPLKALRDKLWLLVTLNRSRQAELMLLFADKRLVSSKILFENGKSGLAYSTLTKAEKYLEMASTLVDDCWKSGVDTRNLSRQVALAALKHREIQEQLLNIAPEDAKPDIVKSMGYSKGAYILCKNSLLSRGIPAPENPFPED